MPKHRLGQDIQAFDHLTEAWKRGRRGVKPEFVPELAAWILVHSMQFERIAKSLGACDMKTDDAYVIGMREYVKRAQSVLAGLMSSLENGWEHCYWNEATGKVADHLGIIYGDPLPEDIKSVADLSVVSEVPQ